MIYEKTTEKKGRVEHSRKWPNINGEASHIVMKNGGENLNKVRLLVKCETWKV